MRMDQTTPSLPPHFPISSQKTAAENARGPGSGFIGSKVSTPNMNTGAGASIKKGPSAAASVAVEIFDYLGNAIVDSGSNSIVQGYP